MNFNVQPYLGVLATLVVGWILDALPGIRVGAVEMVGFIAASAFAVSGRHQSRPGCDQLTKRGSRLLPGV